MPEGIDDSGGGGARVSGGRASMGASDRRGRVGGGDVQAVEVVVEAVARRLLSLELDLRSSANTVSRGSSFRGGIGDFQGLGRFGLRRGHS